MGYTICDRNGDCKPLRVIAPNIHGVPELKAEFTPFWWICDACNRPERRFEITFRSDQEQPQYLSWYQVVTTEDAPSDIACKIDFYRRVLAAQHAMDAASQEYRRLTGCGWSATPLGEVRA